MVEIKVESKIIHGGLPPAFPRPFTRHPLGLVEVRKPRGSGCEIAYISGRISAIEKGREIGKLLFELDACGNAFIQDTTVEPKAQRRGIGRQMVAALEQWGCEHQVNRITGEASGDGKYFFPSVGFRKVAEDRGFDIVVKEILCGVDKTPRNGF